MTGGETPAARQFWILVMATVTDPSAAARELLALNLSNRDLRLALLLAAVASVLSLAVLELVVPMDPALAEGAGIQVTPFAMVVILLSTMLISAFALHWTGTFLGGVGRFEDSLASVIWLQFCLVVLQLGQAVLSVASPALGALVAMASLVLLIWAMTHFITIVHHFGVLRRGFATVILAFVGAGVGLALILSVIGVGTLANNALGAL